MSQNEPSESLPIPTSDALSEASPESLSELFSRDPEGFSKQDLSTIIAELRRQRERFQAAEAGAKPKAKPSPKPSKSIASALAAPVGAKSPEDLGL